MGFANREDTHRCCSGEGAHRQRFLGGGGARGRRCPPEGAHSGGWDGREGGRR